VFHFILWILTASLYFPVFYKLYTYRWHALNYTHAYFILPVSCWLVFRKKEVLKKAFKESKKERERFNLFAFLILVFSLFLYGFGWHQDFMVISTFSFIPFLYGLIEFVYGKRIRKILTFPIFYLLLLVPPPFALLDNFTLPLRYISAQAVEKILVLFRFPVKREGLILLIKGHQILVGQACSGFRTLISMFALGILYVYLTQRRFLKKIILLGLVVPLSLIGNIVRILIICFLTVYFGEKIAQGFFHYFSGIVVFLIVLSGFLILDSFLEKYEARKSKTADK